MSEKSQALRTTRLLSLTTAAYTYLANRPPVVPSVVGSGVHVLMFGKRRKNNGENWFGTQS